MLTARAEDIDCIIGIELGADDYLTKPFNPSAGVGLGQCNHARAAQIGGVLTANTFDKRSFANADVTELFGFLEL